MKQFILQLKSDRHKNLTTYLFGLAILQGGLLVFGGSAVFPEDSQIFTIVVRISFLIMVFLIGCAGFVMMVRQEAQQVVKITGKPAQVFGFLLWISQWCLCIGILVSWIIE